MVQQMAGGAMVQQTVPRPPAAPVGQQPRPTVAQGNSLFDIIDKNHDGVITRDELQKMGGTAVVQPKAAGPPVPTLPPRMAGAVGVAAPGTVVAGAIPPQAYPKQPVTMPPV